MLGLATSSLYWFTGFQKLTLSVCTMVFSLHSHRSMTDILASLKKGEKMIVKASTDDGVSSGKKSSHNIMVKYRLFYFATGVAVLAIAVSGLMDLLGKEHGWVVSPSNLIPITDYFLKLIYIIISVTGHRLFCVGSRGDNGHLSHVTQHFHDSKRFEHSGPTPTRRREV